MKKLIFTFTFLLGLIFVTPARAEEAIVDFSTDIQINQNASISITEDIVYDFGGLKKHGIYRYLPVSYKARGGNFNLRLSGIGVTDENGVPYKFTVSQKDGNKVIKIGDADTLVTGLKTYRVKYTINRAMNFFKDSDELYWNVTGNGWQVPIKQTKAIVNFPADAEANGISTECFAGVIGSAEKCFSSRQLNSGQDRVNGYVFINDFLEPGEGMTIAVSLPKRIVSQPGFFSGLWLIVQDNLILVLPLLIFITMFYLWHKKGRDPEGKGTIIAEYDAPDGLMPIEVGTIIDESAQNKDVSAEIIQLAITGYLKINFEEKTGLLSKNDYELEKIKDSAGLANEFDKILFDSLFKNGASFVKLSDLKDEYYKDLQKIKTEAYKAVAKKKYFLKNPSTVRTAYLILGIIVCFLGSAAFKIFGFLPAISLFVSGVIVAIFSRLMPAKTLAGAYAKEKILGLKLYLSVAEKDRINFHNAPEKKPEIFEKLLPYAMVLGVEKAWAKQFEGIYNGNPGWYNGPSGAMFNPVFFAASLHNFSDQASSVMSSAPSGGSGVSGGGFSGGGFGGGGGGSW